MCQDAIVEEFWIFHSSEYARFLYVQTLHKVLNMPEDGWIIANDSVLNMPELIIWQGCEYARVTQGADNAWIYLNNVSIYMNVP